MVNFEDIIVRTDDEWFQYGQEPLTVYIRETFRMYWMRNFPNLYIRPKGRDICEDCMIFANDQKQNKGTLNT